MGVEVAGTSGWGWGWGVYLTGTSLALFKSCLIRSSNGSGWGWGWLAGWVVFTGSAVGVGVGVAGVLAGVVVVDWVWVWDESLFGIWLALSNISLTRSATVAVLTV